MFLIIQKKKIFKKNNINIKKGGDYSLLFRDDQLLW